ncbi:hypothetical protein WJX72_005459 [[Myrmecia] bisecta]|uniref:Cytochrome c oxidase subunit n=1 Tax=[Myrmecia] bisecta TaxID=41462 RepID=A0AAW1QF29_9CHLO
MSGKINYAEEVKEMTKWKYVTFAAIPLCIVMAAYDLSHGEHHGHSRPAYPYLRIRSKEFPWGDCGLFEDCDHQAEEHEEH